MEVDADPTRGRTKYSPIHPGISWHWWKNLIERKSTITRSGKPGERNQNSTR